MKKRLILFIAFVILTFSFAFSAKAESSLLVDSAQLLSENEATYIRETLEQASVMHDASFVIVTTYETGTKSMTEYADDFFDYGGYKSDGILLLVDMYRGDYYFSTCGKYNEKKINSYVLEAMEDDIFINLADGDFYGAFEKFAYDCYDINGLIKDADKKGSFDWVSSLMIAVVVGVLAALAVTLTMKAQLKSVVNQTRAENYVISGSMNVTESRDLFLYHTVIRTPRPKSTGSGSSHRSSSGRSHGGRGGSFR